AVGSSAGEQQDLAGCTGQSFPLERDEYVGDDVPRSTRGPRPEVREYGGAPGDEVVWRSRSAHAAVYGEERRHRVPVAGIVECRISQNQFRDGSLGRPSFNVIHQQILGGNYAEHTHYSRRQSATW